MLSSLPPANNYKAQLKEFQTKLGGVQGPIALGTKIGGSGTDLLIRTGDGQTSVTELKLKDKSEKEVREMFLAIAHAKQIFVDVASTLEQEVIPMVDSVCGFPLTNDLRNPESPETTAVEGEHYLRNLNRGQTILSGITAPELNIFPAGTPTNSASHNRVYNFAALNRCATEANQELGFDFHYSDDTGKTRTTTALGNQNPKTKVQIQAMSTNDTVLVARSAANKLQKGENCVGIVAGSGFNIGYCENYLGDDQFAEVVNTEIGESAAIGFQHPFLDDVISGDGASLEKLLACKEKGKGGLEARFEHIARIAGNADHAAKETAAKTINSYLNQSYETETNFTSQDLEKAVSDLRTTITRKGYRNALIDTLGNRHQLEAQKLAKALFILQIDLLTTVLSSKRMQPTMTNPKTSKIALTGSWAANIIKALPQGTDIFTKLLNAKLKKGKPFSSSDIILRESLEYDGMINQLDSALVPIKAAMARALVRL